MICTASRAHAKVKTTREELFDALQGEITDNPRFVLDEIMLHIEGIEAGIARNIA